jgi:lysophospholipase L1-like esterase
LRPRSARPFPHYFAILGYAVVSLVVVVTLLELGARVGWFAYHWVHADPDENLANTSPAYAGYSWTAEFWKEEELRWKSQHGRYVPFRVWGVAEWHGKYVNTDETEMGTWRRTINPPSEACEKRTKTSVWMFGGSTLYGTGVPDWATLPSYLSHELNNGMRSCVSVTNFGVEGYVTNQELILLSEQLKTGRHPDLVIFYDGVNDAYAGAISPGIPSAHMTFEPIKARVEGSIAGRLDFLRDAYSLRLARTAVGSLRRAGSAASSVAGSSAKVVAVLDNYEANLRLARALGEAYNFKVYCFWQPAVVFGRKPLVPFEQKLGNFDGTRTFRVLAAVYQEAESRASSTGSFVFLGSIFDSVKEPLYIDRWMHVGPLGNELAAQAIAKRIEN